MKNFASYVFEASQKSPHKSAVWAENKELSYKEFAYASQQLAGWITDHHIKRLALLADRSFDAAIGVVGTAWAGISYIPLSLEMPAPYIEHQLNISQCNAIFIDKNGAKKILKDNTLTHLINKRVKHILFANHKIKEELNQTGLKGDVFSDIHEYHLSPKNVSGEKEAYIIFTSGSTGKPKGVLVSVKARQALIEAYSKKYTFKATHKVAQPCDLCWDVSVGNYVIAWANHATLYLLTKKELLFSANFIQKNDINIWHSVPTIIAMMITCNSLKEGLFPSLIWSDFSGEPLTYELANAWKKAAPNSAIINSYGPTEFTVDCLDYDIPFPASFKKTGNVPIGYPFPECETMILDENISPIKDNDVGILYISGPQIAQGYINNTEKTKESFPIINGKRWYLTGDLVMRDDDGLYVYKGRIDNQTKILGHRIELEAIEAALKTVINAETLCCFGNAINKNSSDYIIALIKGEKTDPKVIRKALKGKLPSYALPKEFYFVDDLETMANSGKLNRKAIKEKFFKERDYK